MKTLREVEWRVLWLAFKRMCFAAGAITLVSWFAVERHPLEAACSFAFVLLVWVMLYKFILAWRAQVAAAATRRIATKRAARTRKPGMVPEFFAGMFEGARDEFRTLRAQRGA